MLQVPNGDDVREVDAQARDRDGERGADAGKNGVRAEELDHPDELRIDLDPVPGVEWPQIRDVAHVVHETLDGLGLTGWPKTSGSRGLHVIVRIEQRWDFGQVRRAALALAREVERRVPTLATSKWWKEERHGVFLDYNQNAKDRTVASVYSVRPKPTATVSAPLTWDEVPAAELDDFTLRTVPKRYAKLGDVGAGAAARACSTPDRMPARAAATRCPGIVSTLESLASTPTIMMTNRKTIMMAPV